MTLDILILRVTARWSSEHVRDLSFCDTEEHKSVQYVDMIVCVNGWKSNIDSC